MKPRGFTLVEGLLATALLAAGLAGAFATLRSGTATVDFSDHFFAEGVHNGHANAVQAAGNFITAITELTAGV